MAPKTDCVNTRPFFQRGLLLRRDPAAPLLRHRLRGLALLERLGLQRHLPGKQVQRQRRRARHRHQHEADPHGRPRESHRDLDVVDLNSFVRYTNYGLYGTP